MKGVWIVDSTVDLGNTEITDLSVFVNMPTISQVEKLLDVRVRGAIHSQKYSDTTFGYSFVDDIGGWNVIYLLTFEQFQDAEIV